MKKTIVILLSYIIGTTVVDANNWKKHYQGYMADITVTASYGIDPELNGRLYLASIETNHGYCYENGWFVGGGAGFEFFTDYAFYIPLYSEIRYYIPNSPIFLSSKIGAEFGKGYGLGYPFLLSEGGGGLFCGRWSFSLSTRRLTGYSLGRNLAIPLSSIRMGISYHF